MNNIDKFSQSIQQKLNEVDPALREEYESFQKEAPKLIRAIKIWRFSFFCSHLVFMMCILCGGVAGGIMFFPIVIFLSIMYSNAKSKFAKKAAEITDKTGLPWTPSLKLLREHRYIDRYPSPWMLDANKTSWQNPRHESLSSQSSRPSSFEDSLSARSNESSGSNWDSSSPFFRPPSFADSVSFSRSCDDSSSTRWPSPTTNPSTGLPMSSGGIDVGGNALGFRRDDH